MAGAKLVELTIDHVRDVLLKEIEIATAVCRDGKRKRFTFNAWRDVYSVTKSGDVVDGGQSLEELVNIYNELR